MTSKDYDPNGGSHFTWIGGVYVQDATTSVYDNEPILGVQAAFAAAGVDPADPAQLDGGFPGDFANDDSYYSVRHYHDKQAVGVRRADLPRVAATGHDRRPAPAARHAAVHPRGAAAVLRRPGCRRRPATAARRRSTPKWNATTPSLKMNWELAPDVSHLRQRLQGLPPRRREPPGARHPARRAEPGRPGPAGHRADVRSRPTACGATSWAARWTCSTTA